MTLISLQEDGLITTSLSALSTADKAPPEMLIKSWDWGWGGGGLDMVSSFQCEANSSANQPLPVKGSASTNPAYLLQVFLSAGDIKIYEGRLCTMILLNEISMQVFITACDVMPSEEAAVHLLVHLVAEERRSAPRLTRFLCFGLTGMSPETLLRHCLCTDRHPHSSVFTMFNKLIESSRDGH